MRIETTTANRVLSEQKAKQAPVGVSFQTVMAKTAENAGGYRPTSSVPVMKAWNAAMKETGIDPLPLNKISAAMVSYVENGRKGAFSSFLGMNRNSAVCATQQIIDKLLDPGYSAGDTAFAQDELMFYSVFLDKLLDIKE